MSNPIRKIRRTILQHATGSRSFKNRIHPKGCPEARKKFYQAISAHGKTRR